MALKQEKKVAYFCAEYGIDSDLPTYSGGLGILSADILNAAADINYPMVGIGILYKGKDFIQHITKEGLEEKRDSQFDHDTSFLRQTDKNGVPLIVDIAPGVKAKSYHLRLADKVILYFLSTDLDDNPRDWVNDMDALYGGDSESQIRQMILLGIGGIRLLKKLDFEPDYYHFNEGRPVLALFEIADQISQKNNISIQDAINLAAKKIIYTNHTLVTAGNPTYHTETIISWVRRCTNLGESEVENIIKEGISQDGFFSITDFALKFSNKVQAVSKMHQIYCKKTYPQKKWIGITNGVHKGRWQDSDFRNPTLTNNEIWSQHLIKKRELADTVLKRTGIGYNPEGLIVSWARRLADYKRPTEIFSDIERLKKIIQNPQKPVHILFAGNSHSGDMTAKKLIEDIIGIFSTKLSGNAIFVPNYNIALANHMVSGSDVWLNTPKGNLEASGTSGMKALANGVLNCTVIDGWTFEVDWDNLGWILDKDDTANSFYKHLETEIVNLYYTRDENNIPQQWVEKMRMSINLATHFSAEETFTNYVKKLYV